MVNHTMRTYIKFVVVISFVALLAGTYFFGAFTTKAQDPPGPNTSVNPPQDQFPTNLNLDCAGCHGPGKTLPYLAGEKFHKDAHSEYDAGYHAKAVNNGKKAATCADCHTRGGDLSTMLPAEKPNSTVNRSNISQTCGQCHSDAEKMKTAGNTNRPSMAYQSSVHAKALGLGNMRAAVCTDCHSTHKVLPATYQESPVSKFNIASTCGKCHSQISTDFLQSVHGTALARGNYQSPNCTDCHGIHNINPSGATRENLGLVGCAQCHDGVRLSQDFGIAAGRVSSFKDSYHGRAQGLGSGVVADCASCHGVHNILPSDNPQSLINKANLTVTCGQCHVGATESFTTGSVHLSTPASEDIGSVSIFWVRNIYMFLIVTIVGGMLVHNGVIWFRKVAARRKHEVRPIVRMSVNQRIQHWMLLTSFIVLVISGFALEYGDTWLGWMFFNSEDVRRNVHRVAAVVMLVGGVYHLFYLAFYREGRRWFTDMLPRWKDVVDLYQTAMFYLFNKGDKPKFARFRYADKAEYWAVVWGTILMGLTGLMIWFKLGVFDFLPLWFIDVAIAIHFYEAILATLAIVVWHFYHVIFDPDVYPINGAFWDGRMTEEMFREEHELAYEEMMLEAETSARSYKSVNPGATEHSPEETKPD